ncbi:hypothetical protein Q7P37_008580 [Cladosporium fusiforme]
MGKRSVYTKITPLPSNIPRQLALDMLRSHGEVISLNPLVTGHKPIPAPREAAADEFFAQWYEITEIITWGLGLKKKISFKGVFYDLPNGLQTHTYAPMGVDLRNKWTVRGNQPGEPREPRELGVETPLEGLYLREDVEIVCNMALTSFVKKEMKAAAGVMVDRMTRKAELLDEGVLHAMFEDGKLKTSNPNVQGHAANNPARCDTGLKSPALPSPGFDSKSMYGDSSEGQYTTYRDLMKRQESQRASYLPAYQREGYQGPEDQRGQAYGGAEKSTYVPYNPPNAPGPVEVEGSFYHPQQPSGQQNNPNVPTFHAELADTSVPINQPEAKPAPLRPHRNSAQQPVASPEPSPALPPRNNSQQQYHSPQPSPGFPNRNSSSHSSQQHPHRASNASHTHQDVSAQSGKRESTASSSYTVTNPDEGFYSRNPSQRSRQSVDQGLANQTQGLSMQAQDLNVGERNESRPDPSQFGSKGALSKCPVCDQFEGDEAAVSHHVEKHFS